MITCSTCGEDRPEMFYPSAKRSSWCKVCQREAVRDGRYRKLGVTRDEYLSILHGQLGACEICGAKEQPVKNGVRGLHLDHDHKTGTRRGILCSNCNQVLGRFKDDVGLFNAAIAYISKYE